ncbi:MAG: hypothetical protein HUJ63_11770 [Enterococcus sp.]|nr:hypothetical protein [Enterococcus sp.]
MTKWLLTRCRVSDAADYENGTRTKTFPPEKVNVSTSFHDSRKDAVEAAVKSHRRELEGLAHDGRVYVNLRNALNDGLTAYCTVDPFTSVVYKVELKRLRLVERKEGGKR